MAAAPARAAADLARFGRRAVRLLWKRKMIPAGEAEIFLLPNAELRRLKRRYLNRRPRLVDVLVFPEDPAFPRPPGAPRRLGEICLNRDIARRDPARARALVVHALLHLAGFSHVRERDTIEMQKAEAQLLRALKVPLS